MIFIKFRRIFCWIRAIPFFLKSDVWCPHVYKEECRENVIIISNDNGFRVSENYIHSHNETVHPKATLVRSRCSYCGKQELSWYDKEPYIIGGSYE